MKENGGKRIKRNCCIAFSAIIIFSITLLISSDVLNISAFRIEMSTSQWAFEVEQHPQETKEKQIVTVKEKQNDIHVNETSTDNWTVQQSASEVEQNPLESKEKQIDLQVINNVLPLFVLHVGPSKTGTTTIQNKLYGRKVTNLLKLDNYSYMGNNRGVLNIGKLYEHCTKNDPLNCTLSSRVTDFLEKNRQIGRNVFASSEYLRKPTLSKLELWKDAVKNKWDFRIVISYRRMHERLPSGYNQGYKLARIGNHKYHNHYNWPGVKGDYRIPSFQESYQKGKYKGIKTSYETWGIDFPYSVYNMHQEGDLTANFVCQMIPGAHHTCKGLKEDRHRRHLRSFKKVRKERLLLLKVNETNYDKFAEQKWKRFLKDNESRELDYDILAVHAYEKGLVHKSFKDRNKVGDTIQKFSENVLGNKSEKDLPQMCLNGIQLDELYKTSLKNEEFVFSIMASQHRGRQSIVVDDDNNKASVLTLEQLNDFNDSWEDTLVKKKLCSVNATQVLEQKEWKEFFKQNFAKKVT